MNRSVAQTDRVSLTGMQINMKSLQKEYSLILLHLHWKYVYMDQGNVKSRNLYSPSTI